MLRKWNRLGIAIVLAGFSLLPVIGKADQWNHETNITLSAPAEIPGQILPAGNYVFQLADNNSDRNIVQIFITTLIAIPAYRLEATNDSVVMVQEGIGGSPDALSRWFFAGDVRGVGFVYPSNYSSSQE
jgi:hypothetical protein